MVTSEMARLCPGAIRLGVARLEDHGWRIAECGYASVIQAAGETVHGVLWELTGTDLEALDLFEGVAEGLYARTEMTVDFLGQAVVAEIYVVPEFRPGRPLAGYVEAVSRAARDQGLPGQYTGSGTISLTAHSDWETS